MSTRQIQNNNSSNRGVKQSNTPTLIKGRVYSVIMDESHPFFEKILGEFDPTYIGYIFWGSLNDKEGDVQQNPLKLSMAKPYFNWLTYTPFTTEIVDLVKAPSSNHYVALGGNHTNIEYFYYPPVNIWNNSAGNPLPRETDIKLANGELNLGDYTDENKIAEIKNMVPFEGDMILEGRFGNSIRFGSSNPRGKNNWSENDGEGAPITIISNGQSPTGGGAIENINNDDSSIYLCSNHNIDNFNIASKNYDSLNATFNEPQSGLEPLASFINSNTSVVELLNPISVTEASTFTDAPSLIIEGQSEAPHGDDESALIGDDIIPVIEGGFEDLTKIPGKYEDNSRTLRELFLVPKRFSNGIVLVTDSLASPLMTMLLSAEKSGTTLIVNSGFRPPVDDIYLNNKLIQKSQKTLRLSALKSQYKGKIKEPWLKNTTVIQPFDGYQVGDSYKTTPQKKHFSPVTAPSYASAHGRSRACDFSTASATSDGYKWLAKNGWKFGFIRTVSSEPWHFGYRPDVAEKGPTALLPYKYEPGKSYKNTTNRWNNVFGSIEPDWTQELIAFQEQQAQQLNDSST